MGQRPHQSPARHRQRRLRRRRTLHQRAGRGRRAWFAGAADVAADRAVRRRRFLAPVVALCAVRCPGAGAHCRHRLLAADHRHAGIDLFGDRAQPLDRHTARYLLRQRSARQCAGAPGARPDANHARLRLPDSGSHAVRPRARARHPGHRDFRDAAGSAPHQPGHPSGQSGAGRSGPCLWRQRLAVAVQGAIADRAAHHHDRRQPDHHDGAVDGHHRLDGRRGRTRQ